jgi:transposase
MCVSANFKREVAVGAGLGYSLIEACRSFGVVESGLGRWVKQLQAERQGVTLRHRGMVEANGYPDHRFGYSSTYRDQSLTFPICFWPVRRCRSALKRRIVEPHAEVCSESWHSGHHWAPKVWRSSSIWLPSSGRTGCWRSSRNSFAVSSSSSMA